MIRGLLALFCAVLAMGTSIAAAGISARNHATALRLHELQKNCELRAAAIEAKTIKVRGFLVDGPMGETQTDTTDHVQDSGAVSGSENLGGSRPTASDVSNESLSGLRFTP